jgi:ribosome maturation factor RimP
MALEDALRQIAEASLLNERQFIVDVVISARKGPKKVLIIVDGDDGVNIDDCASISRSVSSVLDEGGLLGDENYLLEVSTPGLDQPLKLTRQFKKNIGRNLKVKLADQILEGKLENVSDEAITITQIIGTGKNKESKSITIKNADIEKAFVLVSFK